MANDYALTLVLKLEINSTLFKFVVGTDSLSYCYRENNNTLPKVIGITKEEEKSRAEER